MASVIRYLKKKIKPFKRCVTNPSQISFERQLSVKRQKSLDDNYINNYECHENAIDATVIPDSNDNSKKNNQNNVEFASNCYTKVNGYYNTTNDVDDGFRIIEPQAQHKHMLHESTPFFNTHKYVTNNLNSELKHAFQETIEYEHGSVVTSKVSTFKTNSKINLKRCNNNSTSSSNVKSSTLMNGTYTVGNNKLKMKSNSIKSNRKAYNFFLRRRQSSSACKKYDEKMEHQPSEEPIISKPEPIENDCENVSNNSLSTHSDSLCDPLFSSTLKSSSFANCDTSCLQMAESFQAPSNIAKAVPLKKCDIEQQEKVKAFENIGMATVTLSKTAFRKYLNNNQPCVNQYANVINNINTQENVLLESSMEKLRRSISLPGMNDQVSYFKLDCIN